MARNVIERIKAEIESRLNQIVTGLDFTAEIELKGLLSFLDTLEVKEVDLEKEINEWLLRGGITDTRYDEYCDDDIIATAKHFFELGKNAK